MTLGWTVLGSGVLAGEELRLYLCPADPYPKPFPRQDNHHTLRGASLQYEFCSCCLTFCKIFGFNGKFSTSFLVPTLVISVFY